MQQPNRARFVLAFIAVLLLPALPSYAGTADYPLDTMERTTSTKGPLRCPKLSMVRHPGTTVRYHKPVYVYEHFKPQLERFEELLAEVAIEIYGRSPRRIKHVGTYNCRRIRRFPDLLSEHALGNAIDVEGFDFAPAKAGQERNAVPHKRLRRSFQVRVGKHWQRNKGVGAIHANFLQTLTERLLEDDTFRVLLGPAFPGHQSHFHFDVAPYRLVQL